MSDLTWGHRNVDQSSSLSSPLVAVFLSYARQDEPAARTLANALQQEGYSVWWDRELKGGSEYNREIQQALDSSDKVIVLWSAHSIGSAWVRDEATAAITVSKIVPLTIDGSEPPLGFRQYHTIDLCRWLKRPGSRLPQRLQRSLDDHDGGVPDASGHEGGAPLHQRIAFAKARDGVTLAYSRIGEGQPLIKAANGHNHLEHELENPLWRHWVEELCRRNTLIRYDQRGTGMSDRHIPELQFGQLVDDLVTVVDAAGYDRFDLIGISQGTPVAMAFAARHPERVQRLVLINGFAMGWRHSPDRDFVDSWEALSILARSARGRNTPGLRNIFTSQYFPDATPVENEWWNRIQEQSAGPDIAHRVVDMLGSVDVFDLMADIKAQTLVMHCKDDEVVPFDSGRLIASKIAGAEFVALEGRNHLPQPGDPAWSQIQQELRRFLD